LLTIASVGVAEHCQLAMQMEEVNAASGLLPIIGRRLVDNEISVGCNQN